MKQEHLAECDEVIEVHYCGELVRRKDLKSHVIHSCSAIDPLVPCHYYNMGCKEKVLILF